MLARPSIPDDEPLTGWAAVTTGDLNAMSLEQRRRWNAWFMRTYMGVRDLQAEHQADHQDHIDNHEIRIGQRIP